MIIFNRWPGNAQNRTDIVEQAVVTRRMGTVVVLNIRRSQEHTLRDRAEGPAWFHVKLVVHGSQVQVYLDGSKKPAIEVAAMFNANEKGVLGLCGRHFYFADFRYTPAE